MQQGYGELFDPVVVSDLDKPVAFRTFPLQQDNNRSLKRYQTFSEAVDAYFSVQESKAFSSKAQKKELRIEGKIEGVRRQQQRKIKELEEKISYLSSCAEKIEENLSLVDECILVACFSFRCGLSMDYLERKTEIERLSGNKAANTIQCFVPKDQSIKIEIEGISMNIDTTKTTQANRTLFYDRRKQVLSKLQKTVQANELAIQSAEKKIKKKEEKMKICSVSTKKTRKKLWFEKFNWFITSSGEIVIGGKDSTQNELIVKRYMQKNDVYLHGEISGSSSVVIKKNKKSEKIPRQSLFEAGLMSTVYARTWEAKIPASAWWVYPFQVTKTAETGEYLTSGSFVIRGKKNLLPPYKPEYGLGVLFCVDREEQTRENTNETFYKANYKELVEDWVVEPEQVEEMKKEIGSHEEEEKLCEDVSVSKLTGNPEEGDVVHYAIPMCAPYSVVSAFSYNVKLVPGQLKKGQACKEIRMFFEKEIKKQIEKTSEKAFVFEQHLSAIRLISDTDFVETLLPKVRVEYGENSADRLSTKHRGEKKKKKR